VTTVIRVENLGKKYRIQHQQRERYTALRDVIANRAKSLFRNIRAPRSPLPAAEDFWALKDVSFEIKQGEVVGIIGRNGAGKSTLLKVLSRITEPTTGRVAIKGRIASLLEVGTGFHPELTGRENIFLNGAVLGMTKVEIRKKFDEIVAFAEIERFLDTPVKRYSSGMYVRLAFAVAAHLEPEVLIVDEVLAVGDAEFQKKCLGKMSEVAYQGRTVLFVSHNMAAIESLTKRGILLNKGQLQIDTDTRRVTKVYLTSTALSNSQVSINDWGERSGTGEARITGFETRGSNGTAKHTFTPLELIEFDIVVSFSHPLRCDVAIVVENSKQQALFTSHLSDFMPTSRWDEYSRFIVRLEQNLLRRGSYCVSLAIFSEDMSQFYDVVYHYPAFEVDGSDKEAIVPFDSRWGDLYIPMKWDIKK
jgi:lipopolysaccharide transport system ATP-binding protein